MAATFLPQGVVSACLATAPTTLTKTCESSFEPSLKLNWTGYNFSPAVKVSTSCLNTRAVTLELVFSSVVKALSALSAGTLAP